MIRIISAREGDTMRQPDRGVSVVAEIANLLERFADLPVLLDVSDDDGLRVSLSFAPSLRVEELRGEIRYLAGVAQVRAFAERYGLDVHALDGLLQRANSEKEKP